jgi:FkbM family methyltransferase
MGQFTLATNKHGDYCIPTAAAHRPAAQRVIGGGVWENTTVEFMIAKCNGGDIVTAGAFFGDMIPALSKATKGTVWAFEPNPENYRAAAITILLNDLPNVRLQNRALGTKSEMRSLVVRDIFGRSLGGLSKIAEQSADDTVMIEMVGLDETVRSERLSILHFDLEGFEEHAILGAMKTIERHRPTIILETVPAPTSSAGQFLEGLGYRAMQNLDANTVLVSPPSPAPVD